MGGHGLPFGSTRGTQYDSDPVRNGRGRCVLANEVGQRLRRMSVSEPRPSRASEPGEGMTE